METRMISPVPAKKPRLSKLVSWTLIGVLLLLAVQFYQNFRRLHGMYSQIYALQANIEYMKSENEVLVAMLKQMNSAEFIERVAREELGLVKKGEILVITVESEGSN